MLTTQQRLDASVVCPSFLPPIAAPGRCLRQGQPASRRIRPALRSAMRTGDIFGNSSATEYCKLSNGTRLECPASSHLTTKRAIPTLRPWMFCSCPPGCNPSDCFQSRPAEPLYEVGSGKGARRKDQQPSPALGKSCGWTDIGVLPICRKGVGFRASADALIRRV